MRARFVCAIMLSLVVLAGCSALPSRVSETPASSPSSPTPSDALASPGPTAPGSGDRIETTEIREYWDMPGDSSNPAPAFVGMTVDEAESAVEAAGLESYLRSPDGGRPFAVVRSNWVVVAQDPVAGESILDGWSVELEVVKSSDPRAGELIAENRLDTTHALERRFTGEITGYGGDGEASLTTVVVDDAVLELDLIQPIPDGCIAGGGTDEAIRVKESLAPIGARVLVERAERNLPLAYVYLLDSAVPSRDETEGTINEALVRSGWWEPSDRFRGGLQSKYEEVTFEDYAPATYWNDRQLEYANVIARAGNETTPRADSGGIAECRRLAYEDREAFAELEAERKRESDRWYAEYQRRVDSGYYSCRDGDGDGVCHER